MTRYSEKIPEKDIENVIENVQTAQQVAEKNNVPVSAVTNKKARTLEKKKLTVGFAASKEDSTLPKDNKVTDTQQQTNQNPETPIDATEMLKGFWKMIDMGLRSASWLTNGQLDYTPLEESDIEGLAKVSNNNETMRKIATFQGADLLMVLGYAGMKFAPRIKLNKFPKHDDKKAKDMKCKCEECTKKVEELKEKAKQKTESTMQQTFRPVTPETTIQSDKVPPAQEETLVKTNQDQLKEFMQRNLGSNPSDLKAADMYLEKMKDNKTGLRITG